MGVISNGMKNVTCLYGGLLKKTWKFLGLRYLPLWPQNYGPNFALLNWLACSGAAAPRNKKNVITCVIAKKCWGIKNLECSSPFWRTENVFLFLASHCKIPIRNVTVIDADAEVPWFLRAVRRKKMNISLFFQPVLADWEKPWQGSHSCPWGRETQNVPLLLVRKLTELSSRTSLNKLPKLLEKFREWPFFPYWSITEKLP